MRRFTKEELKRHNGRAGVPAYLAYEGKVYDVTHSFLWREGRHQALHEAGEDLSGGLEQGPHGAYVLDRFPVIGVLIEDELRDPR